jgi:hypothetical protein
MPATVSVVSVADIDPAWPIGTWSITGLPKVTTVCNGTPGPLSLGFFKVTVSAGAGLDYAVTSDLTYPIPVCPWSGVPAVGNRAIVGGVTSCQYTALLGPASLTLDSVVLSLTSEGTNRRARLFAIGTNNARESCTVTFEDVQVERTFFPTAVAGHHDETLPQPLVLKGWGELDVADVGVPVPDVAAIRRVLTAEAVGPLPDGIALDANAYALRSGGASSSFEVIVGLTNQGSGPSCLTAGKVQDVTNAAGLPVVSTSKSAMIVAPLYASLSCLRPGERGWLRGQFSEAQTAFGNAARARVSVSAEPAPSTIAQVSATPLRVRHSPIQGLEIDFVGAPGSAHVLFLDSGGLPLGASSSYEVFPKDAARPEVATVSFPLHPVYGEPTRIVVYAGR